MSAEESEAADFLMAVEDLKDSFPSTEEVMGPILSIAVAALLGLAVLHLSPDRATNLATNDTHPLSRMALR